MKEWADDIIKGANWISKYLDVILKERAQLYGMIINLMLKYHEVSVELPPIDEFKAYADKYYVLFEEGKEGKFYMSLMERKQEDGDQS